MSPVIVESLLLVAFWGTLASVVLFASYKWGISAARQALNANAPKWKAYTLALIPPASFGVAIAISGSEHIGLAYQTFWVTATPAVIATGFRYNRQNS